MKTVVTYEFPVCNKLKLEWFDRLDEVNKFVFNQFGVKKNDIDYFCQEVYREFNSDLPDVIQMEIQLEFDDDRSNPLKWAGNGRSILVVTQQNVKYYGPDKGFKTSLNWEY